MPAVGDWVTIHVPGTWQVYQIIAGFNEFRYSLDERKRRSRRTLVFVKQLPAGPVGGAAPRFRSTHCEASLVQPLAPSERERIGVRLTADPTLRSAFAAYLPELPGQIVDLTLRIDDRERLERACESTLRPELEVGVSLDRVLVILATAGIDGIGQMPTNATLQLVNRGHELRDGDFVLRDYRVLPF